MSSNAGDDLIKTPMEQFLIHVASLSLTAKLIYSLLGVFLTWSVFSLLERTLSRRIGRGGQRYRVHKMVTTSAYIIIFALITILFADRLKHAGFAAGLFGAGVVVAMQDIVSSFGGFVSIGFSNLYRVGDRIQVNEIKGDVVDISVMRTTILETGDWVSGDFYNGRIVRIPNSTVLKGLVFNYSQGFRFLWDEIKIRLKSDSDQWEAREMLLQVGKETISDYLIEAQAAWKQIAENYRVENPLLQPTVTLQASGGTLEFSLSYIVDYRQRTVVKDRLFTKIVDEVSNSNGALAWAPSSSTITLPPASTEIREPTGLASARNGVGR